jgi:hypothetical protein
VTLCAQSLENIKEASRGQRHFSKGEIRRCTVTFRRLFSCEKRRQKYFLGAGLFLILMKLLIRGRASMRSLTEALEVTYLPITSLKPNPQNPRVHTYKQVHQIAHSIRAFGFLVPILVNDRLNVVAGHGRLPTAQELGWKTVQSSS